MPNPIVYFGIAGRDKPVLEDFYRTLFDWQLTPANDQYTHAATGSGINGGIGGTAKAGAGYATFYVEVQSVEDTLTRVESRGGKRVMGPEQMPNGPLIGIFTDPEGHTVGLIQAGSMRSGR